MAAAQREAALRQELSMVEERRRQAAAALATEVEGREELHRTIALLQQKTLFAHEREIEHQRKLKVSRLRTSCVGDWPGVVSPWFG